MQEFPAPSTRAAFRARPRAISALRGLISAAAMVLTLSAGHVAAQENGTGAQTQPQVPVPPPPPPQEIVPSVPGTRVILRALDKLTGRTQTFEALVGRSVAYERLIIDVRACYARFASRSADSSAFLQIYDTKSSPEELSFSGWMFASSPALSAMDHPRFDVWVLRCEGARG